MAIERGDGDQPSFLASDLHRAKAPPGRIT